MELYSMLSSVTTVVSLVLFIGIVGWAWSARRREAFRHAADEPFALPDEVAEPLDTARSRQR
ncbi:MAG TPA: CcoQ/FixQ family Cbb3-type cytochrome c oxidase assembly chaperone [Gemmatimonadaceae bacterium]|jgi:cytochrome c oxidase cbb3-type subunit 4|nr:CcoQ/FixQ family Cbb3-type cytochrome c oxidase assembly chaperone [Casimicrobiaceae bacterium]